MRTETGASYRRDLGQNLIARWSSAADTENIAQLIGIVFREKADEPLNTHMANTVRRQMRGDYPWMGPHDYAVVEDTTREGNPLVACVCLWRQTWEYEGIAFEIGRPEFVATDPDYRQRGLIRVLFEMIHTQSAAEGHLVTAITGISYFYRQFGYEYALDLGGKRIIYTAQIPKAKEGEQEPVSLREATVEDIPLIQAFYSRRRDKSIVWTDIPDSYWQYELEGWKVQPEWGKTSRLLMLTDSTGETKGYLLLAPRRWGQELGIWSFEVAPGTNLQALLPSLLRVLQVHGEHLPTEKPATDALSKISFYLGRNHPIYDVMAGLAATTEPPYAWYVRVPDVPAFLKRIAPVLEKRLASSEAAGYTGELKIDFYRGGLHMVFEQGLLTTVENWIVPLFDSNAGAGFPPLVFLQALFGYRSIDELRYAFPDVWVNDDTGYLLKVIFPARASMVAPL
jgi:GNAT superfamily N-acetyltransferase